MRLFERTFEISSSTRILDVGGSPLIWEFASVRPRLTFINLPSALARPSFEASLAAGDGRLLPFRDSAFDVVFSNSVIEHVGVYEDQKDFADEVRRVGQRYWVQTPNRRFPIEMHVMLPFVHKLPKGLQRAVLRRFTLWEVLVRPTAEEREQFVEHVVNELNLLDRPSLTRLFPDAQIIAERMLGFEKSLIAFRA
jgi:hypothetical protein